MPYTATSVRRDAEHSRPEARVPHSYIDSGPRGAFKETSKRTANHGRALGYVLVECLIYVGVVMLVLGIAFSAFYRGLDNSRDLARNADDILRALKAGERWRADLREAVAPPEQVTERGASALEIPKAAGTVVYLFVETESTVWRRERADAPWQPLLTKVKRSEMQPRKRNIVTAWTWDIELRSKKDQIRVRPLFSFLGVSSQRGKR